MALPDRKSMHTDMRKPAGFRALPSSIIRGKRQVFFDFAVDADTEKDYMFQHVEI